MPPWKNLPGNVGFLALGILIMTAPAKAQIASDGTLGTRVNGSLTAPCTGNCLITNGATRGNNLFHSFRQFSLPNGDFAGFVTAPAIQNVIVRVTGVGQPFVSTINGTIATVNATATAVNPANFFLLNPNGIVFGANARVLTGGSFLATTADRMLFQDGTELRTTDSAPLLTVNVPIGLGFTGVPNDIILQGSRLSAANLALVGGNIRLDDAQIGSSGGRIELMGIGAAGVVGLDVNQNTLSLQVPDTLMRGDVTLSNRSALAMVTASGGDIALNARNLEFSGGSGIAAITTGRQAANVVLNATGTIALSQGSLIGDIDTQQATGKGGNLLIQTGSLSVMEGSGFLNSHLGQGDGGNIIINARDRITFDGETTDGRTSAAIISNDSDRGKSGEIQINTGSLSLTNGASLLSLLMGNVKSGNAGNITIHARDAIVLSGEARNGVVGQISSNNDPNVTGNSGNIQLTTGSLSVSDGAYIGVSSVGQGNAGNITIDARDAVTFDGRGSTRLVGVSAASGVSSTLALGNGKGGEIQISAGSLSVLNGAAVNASTEAQGNAGNININVRDRVTVDGSRDGFSSTISSAVSPAAIGNGGDIRITSKDLAVTNGGNVVATTNGQGNGGNITIDAADQAIVSGRGSNDAYSSIQSTANADVSRNGVSFQAVGKGGNLNITTGLLLLNGGFLSTGSPSPLGAAGNIEVNANSLQLDNATIATSTASGNGGNITINARDLSLLRHNSVISATAGILGTGQGTGGGGNILINTPFLISAPLENSDILANAFSGRGGNVTINATGIYWFVPRSRVDLERLLGTTDPVQLNPQRLPTNDITAISRANPTLNGQVTLNTLDLDPSRGLTQLPTNLVDRSNLIAQRCKPGSQPFASSFVVTGRGGLPISPSDPLVQQSALTSWVKLPGSEMAADATVPATNVTRSPFPTAASSSPSELTEARGWTIDANGTIWLVAGLPSQGLPTAIDIPSGCSLP